MAPVSKIWDYFAKNVDGAKCRVNGCNKQLRRRLKSGSTKVFWDHLLHRHKDVYFDLKKSCDSEESAEASKGTPMQGEAENQVPLPTFFKRRESIADEAAKKRNELVMKLIAKKNLPFNIVEDEIFRDLCHRAYPCSQVLPGRAYFSNVVLKESADQILDPVVKNLRDDGFFAITSDYWSHSDKAMLSVTTHKLDADFVRQNGLLACIPCSGLSHTGHVSAELLRQLLERHKLPLKKVFAVVRDGAANMLKFVECLGLESMSFQCAAHAIHNSINGSINQSPSIMHLVNKCRETAAYFHRSTIGAARLKEKLEEKNMRKVLPTQDVCVRWNSTYHMLETVLGIQPVLDAFRKLFPRQRRAGLPANLSEEEVTQCRLICKTLSVFEQHSKLLCCEGATCSSIIPVFSALESHLQSCLAKSSFAPIRPFIECLQTNLATSAEKYRGTSLLKYAMLVDPRFSGKAVLSHFEWRLVKEDFIFFAEKYLVLDDVEKAAENTIADGASENCKDVEDDESERHTSSDFHDDSSEDGNASSGDENANGAVSYWREISKPCVKPSSRFPTTFLAHLQAELDRFLLEDGININENPFQWFVARKQTYPFIFRLSRMLLCVPPTSVASERLFSKATLIYSNDLRNRLDACKVEQLLLLKANETINHSKSDAEAVDHLLFPSAFCEDNSADESDQTV